MFKSRERDSARQQDGAAALLYIMSDAADLVYIAVCGI